MKLENTEKLIAAILAKHTKEKVSEGYNWMQNLRYTQNGTVSVDGVLILAAIAKDLKAAGIEVRGVYNCADHSGYEARDSSFEFYPKDTE